MVKKPIAKIILILGILISVIAPLAGAAFIAAGTIPELATPIREIAGISANDLQDFFIGLGVICFVFSGVGFVMIFIGAFAPMISSFTKNSSVKKTGVAAVAKILAIDDTGARINDNPVVMFTLEVQPTTDAKFTAQTRQTVSLIHMPSYQPGKMLNVKYVPGTQDVAIVGPRVE